jgi:hypothetical protein
MIPIPNAAFSFALRRTFTDCGIAVAIRSCPGLVAEIQLADEADRPTQAQERIPTWRRLFFAEVAGLLSDRYGRTGIEN